MGPLRRSVRAIVAREPGLVALGIVGLLVSVVCIVGVAVHGRMVEPEGKMLAAATFCFGVGLYTLTIAALLPLAGYSDTARRRWRWAYFVFPVYGYVIETLQAFRGIDPRFTEEGEPIDEITGAIFGVTAASTIVLFVLLGNQFFMRGVLETRPVLRLGIRYGVVAVAISFGVGFVMSVNAGRELGDRGDLMLAHALGVHGLQTLPLVALAVSAGSLARQRRWIHAAGAGWLAASLAAMLQAALDQPPMESSALSVVIAAGLAVWALVAGWAIVSSVHAAAWRAA